MSARGSPALPSGLARGAASVPTQKQSLCFIVQHDNMGLEHRTQMGATNARCQPLAFSLSLLSLQEQIHMHGFQYWLPLFPLASPSCLLLWPDETSLFICYYVGIVRSKNQEGACGVCQQCWLKIPFYCHSSPVRTSLSFTVIHLIDQLLSDIKSFQYC